jgi:SRSO17 transposase
MIERALEAGVPFTWVATDSIYGVGEVESVLRRAGKGYVLGVTGAHPFRSWGKKPGWSGTAETIATGLPLSAYVRLSAGEGTKGLRLYDWAYLELADLDAEEVGCPEPGTWTRGLLIRRCLIPDPDDQFATAVAGHQSKRVSAWMISGIAARVQQRALRAMSRASSVAKCRLATASLVSGHKRSAGCSSGV